MSRFLVLLSVLAMFAFTFGLSGCGAPEDTTPAEQGADDHADHDHGDDADHDPNDGGDHTGHDHGDAGDDHAAPDDGDADDDHAAHDDGDMDNAEVEAALAELSADDQVAARAQKTCPVSGGLLGAMGAPYKVTVNGKDVFLCCQGCEAEVKANPEKYGL